MSKPTRPSDLPTAPSPDAPAWVLGMGVLLA
ncbi:ketosynthase, partial [Xanthomonas oryzae pv. oryzae]